MPGGDDPSDAGSPVLPRLTRFAVVRALGGGAAGMVYEALDRETGSRVALKTLRTMNGETLHQLKSEFRALQDIEHPNLIRLDDLIRDGETWVLTMELVNGVSFSTYVTGEATGSHRSTGRSDGLQASHAQQDELAHGFDEVRLRAALTQLAGGLGALHAMGKVHRDIKPDNVLVTLEGRVVVIDLGLVTEATAAAEQPIVGTVLYMAPEQVTGEAIGPACDWYAVGAIVYFCLTGRHPFEGGMNDVMTRKVSEDPPPPSTIAGGVPADLDALCMDLLQREPSARPGSAEVVARLRNAAASRPPSAVIAPPTPRAFVGRVPEFQALTGAFTSMRANQALAVVIDGESGVGKSALVRRFTRTLPNFYGDVLVLNGRCHEREAVPYKALDGILDAIAQYLSTLRQEDALALLPVDTRILLHAFPVLQRIDALEGGSIAPRVDIDAVGMQEARVRLFAAVRELLRRLAAHRPLVLVIDDMQWADGDSLAMLHEILKPPAAPPFLLLLTSRVSHSAGEGSPLGLPGDVRTISLTRLTMEESVELAHALLESPGGPGPRVAAAVAAEAAGHPFFLEELVRHIRMSGGRAPAKVSLDDVFYARISGLLEAPRRLLDVMAVAGIALRQAAAIHAADVLVAEYAAHVRTLRVGHLARSSTRDGEELIETYHDRVREAVVSRTTPDALRSYHERIARALEATPKKDADALATHWLAAGDRARALEYVLKAAEQAHGALAFERTARLYEQALTLFDAESPERQRARIRLAEAHSNAGRGADAARAFAAAAEHAPAGLALDLRRRQAEHLLNAGRFDEGEAVMHHVLSAVGLSVPDSPITAVAGLLVGRARLWFRGLDSQERAEAEVPPHELTRLDACAGVAMLLGVVDTIRAASLQTKTLRFALEAGEPVRLARALAISAVLTGARGSSTASKADAALAAAEAIAERSEPTLRGPVVASRGFVQYLRGDFREAYENTTRGIDMMSGQAGAFWDLRTASMARLWALTWLGHLRDLVSHFDAFLRGADARGDLYGATSMRAGTPGGVALLCGDDPALARQTIQDAAARWTQRGFHNQHYYSLHSESQVDLYEGKGYVVWERMAKAWPQMRRSFMFNIQTLATQALWQRARAALVTAAERPALEAAMLRAALKDARAIGATGAPYAAPIAGLIKASVLATTGHDEDAASLLREASKGFDAVGCRHYAESARWRLGQHLGGDEGHALVVSAESWARAEDVKSPSRILTLVAPGFARPAVARPRLGTGTRAP